MLSQEEGQFYLEELYIYWNLPILEFLDVLEPGVFQFGKNTTSAPSAVCSSSISICTNCSASPGNLSHNACPIKHSNSEVVIISFENETKSTTGLRSSCFLRKHYWCNLKCSYSTIILIRFWIIWEKSPKSAWESPFLKASTPIWKSGNLRKGLYPRHIPLDDHQKLQTMGNLLGNFCYSGKAKVRTRFFGVIINGFVEFWVADNGCIEENHVEHENVSILFTSPSKCFQRVFSKFWKETYDWNSCKVWEMKYADEPFWALGGRLVEVFLLWKAKNTRAPIKMAKMM